MQKVKQHLITLWKDESGQGATEYILLLVVVVGIAMLFRSKIQSVIQDKLEMLGTAIQGFNVNSGG